MLRWRGCCKRVRRLDRPRRRRAQRSGCEALDSVVSVSMQTTVRGAWDGSGDRPLLKISELAERSGVSAGTIRHYLREGLLGGGEDVLRTSRNMAYYPPDYVERIALIRRLQEERFMPLRVIKGALQEDPERVHALIELEDRILERALASAEDS